MLQKKTYCFLTVITFFFVLSVFFFPKASYAEPPSIFDSNFLENYHSLRPFPGYTTEEPVNTAEICGGSITFNDKITTYFSEGDCSINPDGESYACKYSENRSIAVTIDLSKAKLPIMGNTEDVPNSKTPYDPASQEFIDDAERMNEYVSWYLNGTINRAEEPFLDGFSLIDQRKIIDFSGPIRKLLPWAGQIYPKLELISKANSGEIKNQIVGCVNFFGKPIPCYQTVLPDLLSQRRLIQWSSSIFEDLFNKVTSYLRSTAIGTISALIKNSLGINNVEAWIENLVFNWNNQQPPLAENFTSFTDYWINYKEWRGRACIPGPIGLIFCVDTPLRANYWADLFPYIPFSTTEDKKGEIKYTYVQNQVSNGVNITINNFPVGDSVVLYFPHMEETTENAALLQQTFTPKDIEVVEGSQMTDIEPVSVSGDCKIVETRTSPGGDSLLPQPNTIQAVLNYTAKFTCNFTNNDFPGGWESNPSCTKDFKIKVGTTTTTPLANEIWSQLVAGSNSIFRMLFPKTGQDSSLGTIRDIPASSQVTYSSEGISDAPATLYFPHIGGISEYFLKGIQTALRPKGYGDPVVFGASQDLACNEESVGTIPTFTPASNECSLGKTSTSWGDIPSLPPTLISALESAAQDYQIPPSLLLGIMLAEGAFNPGNGLVWSEQNVRSWIQGCSVMPKCDLNDPGSIGPFQWIERYWNEHKDAVKKLSPEREPNRCNLLDQMYAVAQKVSAQANDVGGEQCFGLTLNSGSGNYSTCGDWDKVDVASGIRKWNGMCLDGPETGVNAGNANIDYLYSPRPCLTTTNEDYKCEVYQECFGSTRCTSYYSNIFYTFSHYKTF